MPRATYYEIAEVIVTRNDGLTKDKKFIVCPPSGPDEALTVYPPRSYHDDHGVDVFLSENKAEFWIDGYKSRTLHSIQDAHTVAAAVIIELEAIQADRVRELAE